MKTAFRDMDCAECYGLVGEGEPIYFTDEGKVDQECARKLGLVCPQCHNQKQSKFPQCYQCSQDESKAGLKKKKMVVGGRRAGQREDPN